MSGADDPDLEELAAALQDILLAPKGKAVYENRKPTKEELEILWMLSRVKPPKPD